MGKLYLVPTPIGNLADMTFRGVETLKAVTVIAAEDTRVTKKLLGHYGLETPMVSYHEHNELGRMAEILMRLSAGDVALVSDAGMPGVSDPGYKLIREAIERGYQVVALPGANALLPALVASGLPTDSFIFLGFLPKKSGQRRQVLEEFKDERRTLVLYESPRRLAETLAAAKQALGDRPVAIARELSKKFEEVVRTGLKEAGEALKDQVLAGEVTLVIGGAAAALKADEASVRLRLAELRDQALSKKELAKRVAAEMGWRTKEVYNLLIGKEAE